MRVRSLHLQVGSQDGEQENLDGGPSCVGIRSCDPEPETDGRAYKENDAQLKKRQHPLFL
jgi:hypothetical protein